VQLLVDQDDFPGWEDHLADPPRAKRSYWHLVLCGPKALRAVRARLSHPNRAVRDYCTKAWPSVLFPNSERRRTV